MDDNQTRSQLQTDQQFLTVSSQDRGFRQNSDGSYNSNSHLMRPRGQEINWLHTAPDATWFSVGMYGPPQPWID